MKAFVPGYGAQDTPQVREKSGKVAGAVGIATNLLLFAIKLAAGLVSGSVAVMADAVNNLTDSGSSIVMLVGFKLAGKPADEKHPFGHARIEYLSGVIVSFIVLFLGLELGRTSFEKIISPQPADFSALALVILVVSVLLKLWLFFFYRRLGSAIHNGTLLAASKDSLGDVLSTGAVLLSVLAYLAFNWAIDGWIGLLVAAVVLKGGFDVCRDTMDSLLGGKPDPEKIRQIRELLLAREGILGIHDLVLHDYGPGRCIASVHAEVSADANIVAIHEVIDDAEREIGQKMHMAICIHMDPIVTSDDKVNHVHQQMSDFLKNTDPCLSLHDFRMVPGQGHINLIFDCVTPAGYKGRDELLKSLNAYARSLDDRYRLVVQFDTDYT